MKVKAFSYKKGIVLPKIKSLVVSEEEALVLPSPSEVYVSVRQVKGLTPRPVVVKGDYVKAGSVLASVGDNVVYSPVSGEVVDVTPMPSVYGSNRDTIIIKNDGKNNTELWFEPKDAYTKQEFSENIKKANVVDYDGFCVHSKLEKCEKFKKLIVNAVTDEPYETNNIEVIKFSLNEIINGARLICASLGIKEISIAITKDYYSVFRESTMKIPAEDLEGIEVCLLPNVYPCGDEKELYYALTKKNLGEKSAAEEGVLILDIYTVKTIFTLLTTGICDTHRLITVHDATGKTVVEKNVWAMVGTSIEDIVNAVRPEGLTGVHKLVAGGPMRGIALGSEKASITKGLKSIILFSEHVKDVKKEVPCINCGACDKVCPVNISPMKLDKVIMNMDMVRAKEMNVEKCTRCGCCSYVCPSKRYLTQRMCYSKEFIKDKGI